MTWQARIRTALDERRAADAFRVRRVVENGAGRFLSREGERFCNFSSNDYLGLSQHPQIVAAWQQGAERYGVGSGGSGHVSGYSDAHRQLEEALEDFAGCAVIISHDRWFLDRIATHILAFEGDSHVEWFEGNFQDYEKDKLRRLGQDAAIPHRATYKKLTR